MASKDREIPQFKSPIIETHCHLDYLKKQEPAESFKKASEVGIEKIITISVTPDNLAIARKIASENEHIYCTQGIHPHDARLYTEETEKEILAHLSDEKVLAVGEIGLDYHYDNSPREKQKEVFDRQLEIACQHDLPVVIHSRDAEEDTMELMAKHLPKLKRKGVIHSFTSSLELARFAIENDFYLGFNGIITFNSADNVREALHITPLEKILLETDAPFLTPTPYRGRENGPFYLPFVAERMATELNIDIEKLLDQVYKNSFALFKFN